MGVEENRKVVQQTYEAFGRGEMETVFDALADDIVWTWHSFEESPIRGTYYGKGGVQQFFTALLSNKEFHKFEVTEILAAEDGVVVLINVVGTIKSTGKIHDGRLVHIIHMRDGRYATWEEYEERMREPLGLVPVRRRRRVRHRAQPEQPAVVEGLPGAVVAHPL